jgi:hypothetical protein
MVKKSSYMFKEIWGEKQISLHSLFQFWLLKILLENMLVLQISQVSIKGGLTINIDIYRRRVHFEMDCVPVYHRIVSTMFEDGIVNAGRRYVLYVFTQTYCAQYPDRACDIWTAYNRVVEGLRCVQPINSQEIWPIRSHHFWSISQSDYRKKEQIRKQDT